MNAPSSDRPQHVIGSHDLGLITQLVADSVLALSPDDRAERERAVADRRAPEGVTVQEDGDGWFLLEWGGRFLRRVHRSELFRRDTSAAN